MAEETVIVELTVYERNVVAGALAETWRLNPRSDQQSVADRAYYKLVHAPPKADQAERSEARRPSSEGAVQ